ncbi:Uncharacterised protein [Salmonella enterica subsp. enterica serovar Typhimurium str. DT104]|nr:Uncharacterised protein [Salmonella enterica subsp. enterica serovar Typhimurium str. DT104]
MVRLVEEIKALNGLVVNSIRTLPLDQVVEVFGIDREVAKAIRKIPKKKLYVLNELTQSLLTTNNKVLKECVKSLLP